MIPTAGSYEGDGVAEARAQRELTERVGTRLPRRSRSHNLSLRTWTSRFGMRRSARVEA
jgi:hypothetical protein